MATGFVYHELYMWHDTGTASSVFPPGLAIEPDRHAENADTKRRLRNLVEVSGLIEKLVPIKPRAATVAEVARFHDRRYINRIRRLSADRGGDAGNLTPFGPGSYEIALLAAGGTITAVDAVLSGKVRNVYALVRPPGHHAERDRGLGFCIFGNVAIAILHARAKHGLERVATVDWDVHHGNGTQQAFYGDPHVLTISLHQDRLFPIKGGGVDEIGAGKGRGYNLNIPLPPGSGTGAYLEAFRKIVLPALKRFRPELILAPSGFDGGGIDPLGRMMLASACYRQMTRLLMEAADELCDGRLALSHEGGYSSSHVPYCGLAVLEQLSGERTGIEDPWLWIMERWGQQELQAHQRTAIRKAAANLERIGAPAASPKKRAVRRRSRRPAA
ncbi:MAG: class II histone deacetylase [Pseudomonadota bacterium]